MTPEQFQNGYIQLVDKPYTWTSFQLVNKLKYVLKNDYGLKKIKIGHAGTLDPLATGLLIVCIGKATKQIETLQAGEKEYNGTFIIGATTPCFDKEKPIDATYPTEHITEGLLRTTANNFIGEIDQIPPTFSAVKINGRRAYEFARNQENVEIKSKKINISVFELTRIALPEVDFRIVCSKGTYIRAVARDFGFALKSGAHLSALRRERVGQFSVKEALSIDEVRDFWKNN